MLTVGSLFSGIGGLELGLEATGGFKTLWQVEIDDYASRVLARHWPDVARFRDVRECGAHNLEPVDLICGGFPCQDISVAGHRIGIEGSRSGLWREYARIVGEIRPRFVLVENVAALLDRGMGVVVGDLATLGYDAEWSVVSACTVGAPHARERLFLLAYPHGIGWRARRNSHADNHRSGHWEATQGKSSWQDVERWVRATFQNGDWNDPTSKILGMDDGVSARLDRLHALGNAVVPQVVEWIGRRILEAEATS